MDSPGLSNDELIELRIKLLKEEVEEYAEAQELGIWWKFWMPLLTLDISLQAP